MCNFHTTFFFCVLFYFIFAVTLSVRDSSCPRICTAHGYGDPVCGTDGVIYPNICEMKKKTCGKGVKLSPDQVLCRRSSGSKCEHRCNSEKDPVCGTDGRTHLNRCLLQVEICRYEYYAILLLLLLKFLHILINKLFQARYRFVAFRTLQQYKCT